MNLNMYQIKPYIWLLNSLKFVYIIYDLFPQDMPEFHQRCWICPGIIDIIQITPVGVIDFRKKIRAFAAENNKGSFFNVQNIKEIIFPKPEHGVLNINSACPCPWISWFQPRFKNQGSFVVREYSLINVHNSVPIIIFYPNLDIGFWTLIIENYSQHENRYTYHLTRPPRGAIQGIDP